MQIYVIYLFTFVENMQISRNSKSLWYAYFPYTDEDDDRNATSGRRQEQAVKTSAGTRRQDGESLKSTSSVPSSSTGLFS